jgi:hypothetical protein
MYKTAIFLPWRSEFGTMIMHYVRWVNHEAKNFERTVVCTRPGLEALFPAATEFFYDWSNPPDECKNTALLKSRENEEYLQLLGEKLLMKHPGAELMFPIRKMPVHKDWDFTPVPKVVRGLKTDVVIAPRFRNYGEHRNFEGWMEVAKTLDAVGIKMMSIGAEETSVTDLPVEDASWKYDSLDACLEMMQNCKLVVASESGMAHLAVLAGAPLAVIYDLKGKEAGHHKWSWNFPHLKSYSKAYCEPIIGGWFNPSVVTDFIINKIR